MNPLLAAGLVTLVAAATDLRRFRVYNALTFPALLGGLVASTWIGGLAGLGHSLLGAATGFGVLVVFHALGGVGAGDVKLFTALGAWLGPRLTLEVLFAASMAGAAYALILAVTQSGWGVTAFRVAELGRLLLSPKSWRMPGANIGEEVRRPDRRRRLVPFAAMTCLGFFATAAYHRQETGPVGEPGRELRPPAAWSSSHGGEARR